MATGKYSRALKKLRVCGDVAYVPLSKGYEAIIDSCMADDVGMYNWCAYEAKHVVYAARVDTSGGKRKNIPMHRFILGFPDCEQVDHKNGNGLDNRKENLRPATISQNACNRKRNVRNISGYKGVNWNENLKKWEASIKRNGKRKYLGIYILVEDAAKAVENYLKSFDCEYWCNYEKN